MPFGKHRGKHVSEVPPGYLEYMLKVEAGTSDDRIMFLKDLQRRDEKYRSPRWERMAQ